jgi:hypothetical protein
MAAGAPRVPPTNWFQGMANKFAVCLRAGQRAPVPYPAEARHPGSAVRRWGYVLLAPIVTLSLMRMGITRLPHAGTSSLASITTTSLHKCSAAGSLLLHAFIRTIKPLRWSPKARTCLRNCLYSSEVSAVISYISRGTHWTWLYANLSAPRIRPTYPNRCRRPAQTPPSVNPGSGSALGLL